MSGGNPVSTPPASRPRIVRRAVPVALLPGLSPVLARVLAARGVTGPDDVACELARLAPPSALRGIDVAVDVLAEAVSQGSRVLVIGDYDADGATSTALCVSLLAAMGGVADFLVPDRFRFGYGLSPEIVEVAAQRNPAVILTVDNGISSHEGIARAKSLGIRVVVTDHHLPGESLPDADAIVNPNQPGCAFPSKVIAGVGVAFCVMSALRTTLRARGWFGEARPEPNLAEALDLVALGTVADVVPLDANNRVLVEQGLRRMRAGRVRPGIAALIDVAGRRRDRLVAADLGFAVAPRLNAAGRLDDMTHGIRCLLARDEEEALRWARELDTLNRERRNIEDGMREEALRALTHLDFDPSRVPSGICLFDARWHPGVIGILAARIRERFHRPVVAFAPATRGSDELRGSARSIDGVHVRDVLDAVAARHPGLLRRFGGHAMAAGLTLARADFAAFADAFDAETARVLPAGATTPAITSDGELPLAALDLSLAEALRSALPWGQGFPAPLFDGEYDVLSQKLVGEKHVKLSLSSPEAGGRVVDAIAFNAPLLVWAGTRRRAHLAFRVDVNEFRGVRSPQLVVEWMRALPG